ncbi:MAG: M23 family metallopeptidase [Thermoleophilia bacterium]
MRRSTLIAALCATGVAATAGVLQTALAVDAPAGGGAAASVQGVAAADGTAAQVTATSSGDGGGAASAAGLTLGLGSIGSVDTQAHAARNADGSTADGEVVATDLVLLDGHVHIGQVSMRADATSGVSDARAEVVSVDVSGVTVDGVAAAAGAGTSLDVPGVGSVRIGESSADGPASLHVNAVHVVSAAGGELTVGHMDLAAAAGSGAVDRPAPVTAPSPDPELAPAPPASTTARTPSGPPSRRAGTTHRHTTPARTTTPAATTQATTPTPPAATGSGGSTSAPVVTPPKGASAVLPAGSYTVPVSGATNFTDDYGAPRAGTGWHHGIDVFAAIGTPVVAVADGTVSKVGWNDLGGNRLWLTDGNGTGYYYAHLSAYAPVARDGGRVRAGEVVGYVGNTGQAATTPPHLHFEIHPGGEPAPSIDPFPFLSAWRLGGSTAFETARPLPAAPDASSGAVMVGVAPERDSAPPAPAPIASSAR